VFLLAGNLSVCNVNTMSFKKRREKEKTFTGSSAVQHAPTANLIAIRLHHCSGTNKYNQKAAVSHCLCVDPIKTKQKFLSRLRCKAAVWSMPNRVSSIT
jgi:hypothetical protein